MTPLLGMRTPDEVVAAAPQWPDALVALGVAAAVLAVVFAAGWARETWKRAELQSRNRLLRADLTTLSSELATVQLERDDWKNQALFQEPAPEGGGS